MAIEIPLSQGYVAVVDDEDAVVAEISWRAIVVVGTHVYGCRTVSSTPYAVSLLHREVMARVIGRPLEKHEHVDHIDGNGLNNCRSNIRVASRSQNMQNRRGRTNSKSGLKGAGFDTKRSKWTSRITVEGKKFYLGTFDTAEEAHDAYVAAAIHYFGEFANDGQRPLRLADAPPALVQLPLFDMEIAS